MEHETAPGWVIDGAGAKTMWGVYRKLKDPPALSLLALFRFADDAGNWARDEQTYDLEHGSICILETRVAPTLLAFPE